MKQPEKVVVAEIVRKDSGKVGEDHLVLSKAKTKTTGERNAIECCLETIACLD